MRRKSLLSGCILTTVMILLLISEWRAQTTTSSVQFESRRQIQKEVYYTPSVNSGLILTPKGDDYKSITVTPTPIIVGESELVGLQVSDLNIEKDNIISNRWDIELSTEEINLLAKILWTEARGEPDKGQQAVIEVVLNRMIHWDFEGSLYDVLSSKGQFCSWKIRNDASPTDKEYANIDEVLSGNTDLFDYNKVYFSTNKRNNKNAEKIGNHWFCDYEYATKKDKR